MRVFAALDGTWRGPAWTLQPNGDKRAITQTERIGPFLDGSVKIIEGRGIVSYDASRRSFTLHSHAQGRVGDFPFRPTDDGYAWEIAMGPTTIRYVATIKDGTLREVGDLVAPGREPVRIFEMTLTRIGDSAWPAAGQVPMR